MSAIHKVPAHSTSQLLSVLTFALDKHLLMRRTSWTSMKHILHELGLILLLHALLRVYSSIKVHCTNTTKLITVTTTDTRLSGHPSITIDTIKNSNVYDLLINKELPSSLVH